ncbi:MAG: hypothetical protein NNA23_04390 [Nitrospira sp.]|nr:hypothetical protein [Nitrospira sp.]MCP9465453.1 hypothetical protein [Nitrospira sp.]
MRIRKGTPPIHRCFPWRTLMLLAVTATLAACGGPGWDGYFKRGVGRLTQDDVRDKLGPPHAAKTPVLGGDSLWVYRVALSEQELSKWTPTFLVEASQSVGSLVGKPTDQPKPTLYCYRYLLTFAEDRVLKSWKREECAPGTREALSAR